MNKTNQNIDFEINRIIELCKKGFLDEAKTHTIKLLQTNSNIAFLHNLLGAINYSQGNLYEAKISYKKATLVDKKYSEAFKYSLIITLVGLLCLNISSKIAANNIIFNNLSVRLRLISSDKCFSIFSSMSSTLSRVPETTSLINFLYLLFVYKISSVGFIKELYNFCITLIRGVKICLGDFIF